MTKDITDIIKCKGIRSTFSFSYLSTYLFFISIVVTLDYNQETLVGF